MTPRQCPECSATFTPSNGRARFCCSTHKEAFHTRNANRGKVMVGLVQTWRAGKHGAGSDVARYAMAELCALADIWNADDRKAGRLPAAPIREKSRKGCTRKR